MAMGRSGGFRCASRAAAILYGKGAVFRVIPASRRRSLRHDRIYGVLSWRAIWIARHVSGRSGILHAERSDAKTSIPSVNHVSADLGIRKIRQLLELLVKMACNTNKSPDES